MSIIQNNPNARRPYNKMATYETLWRVKQLYTACNLQIASVALRYQKRSENNLQVTDWQYTLPTPLLPLSLLQIPVKKPYDYLNSFKPTQYHDAPIDKDVQLQGKQTNQSTPSHGMQLNNKLNIQCRNKSGCIVS